MSTGCQPPLANPAVGRAKPPSVPGDLQRHLQAGRSQLRRQQSPHSIPLGMEMCYLPSLMDDCFGARLMFHNLLPQLLGLEEPSTLSPGSVSIHLSRRPGVILCQPYKQLPAALGKEKKTPGCALGGVWGGGGLAQPRYH